MIEFERTRDVGLVKKVLTHPRIWPHVTDDFAPAPEAYQPASDDGIWWVTAKEKGTLLGLFLVFPHNHVCWEVHAQFLPEAWGSQAKQAAREAIGWLFRKSHCRRIVASIPMCNRLAIGFAKAAGMRVYGVNEKSWKKNGELIDQLLFGISKED